MHYSCGMDTFGERLAHALWLARKDRKSLAAHLGISVQAVGHAVRGRGAFDAAHTAHAARYLRVDWFWLATGEGTPELKEGVRLTDAERETLARVLREAGSNNPIGPH